MRILFHYTHKQTLGHTTRSIALASALCRAGADVLILQGGLPQSFIRFPKACKVLDIPHPFDTRTSFESHAVPVSATQRAKFILKAAADFAPDVFITEFFPFGRLAYTPELLPTIRFLRKKGVRIIASIGYPLLIDLNRFTDAKFSTLHRAIFALYDHFLIHTPKELETKYIHQSIQSPILARLYAAIIKDLSPKLVYTGYVFPEKMMTGGTQLPPFKKSDQLVVISRGGGAVYPKLITLAIEASRLLDKNTRTIIACGPATTAEEMALFQSSLKPEDKGRIFLADHLSNLDEYIQSCAVSVCLCGYNTSVQLMRHGTPSVVVPYQNNLSKTNISKTTTNDQIARSQLLHERFTSIILDYDTMSSQSLADAIQKKLAEPRPKAAPKTWFNGAAYSAHFIVEGIED